MLYTQQMANSGLQLRWSDFRAHAPSFYTTITYVFIIEMNEKRKKEWMKKIG